MNSFKLFRAEMAEVDHSESDVVTTEEIGVSAVKADEKAAILVDPRDQAKAGAESRIIVIMLR